MHTVSLVDMLRSRKALSTPCWSCLRGSPGSHTWPWSCLRGGPGPPTWPWHCLRVRPGPSYLALVQPGVLHSVVQLAQLLIGVAHVLVPQPCLALRRDVEELPHLFLDGCWGQADTSLCAFSRWKDNSHVVLSKLRHLFCPFQTVMRCSGSKALTDLSPLVTPKAKHLAGSVLLYSNTQRLPLGVSFYDDVGPLLQHKSNRA